MKIKIKHNIKREGCTLSGQLLDCQFLDGAERGDWVDYFSKDEQLVLTSCSGPQISDNMVFVWGKIKKNDFNTISYTYPTEQAAQDMLDFINTFVEKEGTVQSEPKEKRYMLIEVGGRCCQALTNDNVCVLGGDCDNCPHGKTLEEMAEIMTAGTDNIPKSMSDTTVKNGIHSTTVKIEVVFIYGLKALLGGEEGK